uniref:Uncharacterized protein n=1 Tax=Rhizophora mucronata TaxID=61149 RepID=A0A2P2KHE4_RHIMU
MYVCVHVLVLFPMGMCNYTGIYYFSFPATFPFKLSGLVHGEGTETKLIPSLAALHGLDCLESLNLEHTKVSDAALEPLSICQELRHLYLQSPSITDVSLHHLSSLSKLKRLSIRDAVLTDCGLESFSPPTTLEMLDVRGCWLLTEDAIFPFSRKHPLIEVRHEHSVASPSNQSGFNCISPSQKSLKTLSLHHKQGKMPMSWPISQGFIDQRMKYNREELLALQCRSLSQTPPPDKGAVIPKMQ